MPTATGNDTARELGQRPTASRERRLRRLEPDAGQLARPVLRGRGGSNASLLPDQLRQEDIGSAARGPFMPDPLLPKNFPHVTSHDYDGSGLDRGHMCPAKDRSATQGDIDATFYLTNIVPQSPACNQRGWERLEDYCRRLAREGHVLQIAAGPAGVGGTGKSGPAEAIGKGRRKIVVPHQVWKVVLVLPHADAEPRKNTRVIAVVMPNDQTVGFDWSKYRVSVRRVEKLTGYNFFPALPEEVAAALKDRVDEVEVRLPRPRAGGGGKQGKRD
jgi:endonuclease G, mitochondrial